jgi:two-component system, sensor histidine kinase and response regulator
MKPTMVGNGEEALRALEQAIKAGAPFSLVLLDARMPVMDGFSIAKKIRANPNLAVPIVMMLSSDEQTLAGCRFEPGFQSTLTKPVRQSDLFNAILGTLGAQPRDRGEPFTNTGTTPQPSARKYRILLAEDNVINQRVAVRLLEKQGHSIVVAANGKQAVDIYQTEGLDIILMDVQMPDMNGYEATAAIREIERVSRKHIPIIAMTAHAMKGDREHCLEAGMDGYLSKPIKVSEVVDEIQRVVALCSD